VQAHTGSHAGEKRVADELPQSRTEEDLGFGFPLPASVPHPSLSRTSNIFCSVSFTSENSQMKGSLCKLP
jgi:hypothetical protein